MPQLIGLDFETYSSVDLKRHGLSRYVNDKHFMPLIGSVAWKNHDVVEKHTFDFVAGMRTARLALQEAIGGSQICAHNAPFEERVLNALGLDYPSSRFIDSAVVARCAGAASKLEAAGPQLLGIDKIEQGLDLIKLFCVPGYYQERNGSNAFDPQIARDYFASWDDFALYCEMDAQLSLQLVDQHAHRMTPQEQEYMAITMDMNRTGWRVDLSSVEEMQRRYLENVDTAVADFMWEHDAADLNLNSHKQLKAWCRERGVRASSFDESHVASMLMRLTSKLNAGGLSPEKAEGYQQVVDLLHTKQVLGGSSLKKLKVILDTADTDHWDPKAVRLFDQYLHYGAGQSGRTTGRSTQMQNLKRLAEVADMDELEDPGSEWDNSRLASNLRQVFTASDTHGALVVGDFKSVESRGLAWMAGEHWKTTAYHQGKDLYKVLASKIYSVPYDSITKEQRQAGKVGELACGYGAGSEAVREFARGMSIDMSEGEAVKLVFDWRNANPAIVSFWRRLDDMLHSVVLDEKRAQMTYLSDDTTLHFTIVETPSSMAELLPGSVSVMMLVQQKQRPVLRRLFIGCHRRGTNIGYYRPTSLKSGDLWKSWYTDAKTKQVRFHELYGGKLAGILTQSFCRELFMQSLKDVHDWTQRTYGQVSLVGQFHDEIVLDWKPGAKDLSHVESMLRMSMSDAGGFTSFPLEADVKSAYRYIK